MRWKRTDFLFLLLWLAAGFLLLKGLGHTLLWQDEAHTALLGERVLQFGYPKVWDGKNLITGMNGLDFNGAFALTWDGWLPHYIAAVSLWLLGDTPTAARLPFALIAVATLPLLYRFVIRLTKDKALAFWSAAFLATSMTFLLHGRQCRYYALLPFGMLLVLDGLLDLPRWRGRWLMALGLTILYHANFLAFGLALVALGLLPLFFKADTGRVKAAAVALAIAFAATSPMFLYTRLWEKSGGFQPGFSARFYGLQIFTSFILWNKFHLPAALLAAAVLLRKRLCDALGGRILAYTAVLTGVCLLLIPLKFYSSSRYFLPLLPATSLILALFHVGLWRRSKTVGVFFFLLFFGTHAWDYLPEKALIETAKSASRRISEKAWNGFWRLHYALSFADDEEGPSPYDPPLDNLYVPTFADRFWRTDYRGLVNEIFHPFPDGLAEVADFLKHRRLPEERVYLSVGQYPLLFHAPETLLAYTLSAPPPFATDEPVDASQWDLDRIDWFVARPYKQPNGPNLSEEAFAEHVQAKGWKLASYRMGTPPVYWEGNWPNAYRAYRIKQGEFPVLVTGPTVVYHVVRTSQGLTSPP
jgi:hypothetical protein